MSEYRPTNVLHLLQRRQLGLPLKEKGRAVRNCRNNYRCDFELLKTLLCDRQLYLEVIACRKVSRSAEPSFCHNRLFTNNYRSWFNLCTNPTAGPTLMKTNIFSKGLQRSHQDTSPSDCPKIVDAVTVNPPNGCVPLPNSQHLPCILLLAKNGWLYQYNLEDAALLNKFYIRTKVFSDDLVDPLQSSDRLRQKDNIGLNESRRPISSINFRYQYITLNGAEGHVLIRSNSVIQDGIAYVAYALLALFPLRLVSHFVTKAISSNLKAELWTDIFVLTATKGSTITLYGFKDIEKLYHIDSSHIHIGKKLLWHEFDNEIFNMAEVGGSEIGLPYTTEPIDLENWQEWSRFQLFRTKALKHIFRVGGVPYHYAVPVDNDCTSWSLRGLPDSKEIAKFHVDEQWDQSHVSGVDFHPDESGRLLLVNKDTVTVYKIDEERSATKLRSSASLAGTSGECTQSRSPCKSDPTKIITVNPLTEADFQLRVIDSPCKPTTIPKVEHRNTKCKITKCFGINVSHNNSIGSMSLTEKGEQKWTYPSQMATVEHSSYGRRLRQTPRYVRYHADDFEQGVRRVSYEDELDVLAVLHFRVATEHKHFYKGLAVSRYDLVVSLYDNSMGYKMNTIVLEEDIVPSDGTEVSIIMDEDTIIYTKTEINNMLNYKIMRFCRKY